MSNIGRYIRTLRHLRVSQLSGQVMTRARKLWRDPASMLAGEPAEWRLGEVEFRCALGAPALEQSAADLAAGTFCFINQRVELGVPVNWDVKEVPRLWSYNLHYFDWLWSLLGAESVDWVAAKSLTLDWIENHPPSRNPGGWEPYPISLRLINWALLYGVKCRETVSQDAEFEAALLGSVSRQVRWLELNLETHIQANHLLENLVSLVCVGSVFSGDEAQRVFARYIPMLRRELNEQIFADGMHYERSPMYHMRMLWLVEVLESILPERELQQLEVATLKVSMRKALAVLRHPDGEISLLNDAVCGIYKDNWKSEEAMMGAWALPDSGYYGYRSAEGHYLIADAGAVGPDYQPGHAHADYLSFELSMHGQRLITDAGVGTYNAGERRSFDRSTAAHSTVEVAGQNSAEVWGGFRVGRRVTPTVRSCELSDDFELVAEHRGYHWLPSKVTHQRRFSWRGEVLTIEDILNAKASTEAVSRLHFAPSCALEIIDEGVRVENGGHRYLCKVEGECELAIEQQPSCLEFGITQQRDVVVMKFPVKSGQTSLKVEIQPV